MYLKMRNGNVCIEPLGPNEKTPSGIFIPTTVRQGHLQMGKVISVGPGELVQGHKVEMDLKVGDDVIYDSSHSEPLTVDGKTVFVCNMVDIVATIAAKHLSIVPEAK